MMLRRKMEMDEAPLSKRRKAPKNKNPESVRKLTIISDAEEEKNIMEEKHYLEIVNSGDIERCGEEEVEGEPLVEGNGLSIVGNNLLMGLDNTNYRLIRYTEDGTAEVVSTTDGDVDGVVVTSDDGQQQQFLQFTNAAISEDNNIQGTLVSEVVDDTQHNKPRHSAQPHVQYVQVVERDQVPLVYFTAGPEGLTPTTANVGRRKRGEFVLPTDTSKFKMFLYSCKLCEFKCNAIKELTAHRSIHQASGGAGRFRSLGKMQHTSIVSSVSTASPSSSTSPATVMLCGLCNFKAGTKLQMVRHVARSHSNSRISTDKVESEEDLSSGLSDKDHHGQKYEPNRQQITFYRCDKCNLQTGSKHAFKKHVCNRTQQRL